MTISEEQVAAYVTGSLSNSGIVYGLAEIHRALPVYRTVLGHGLYHLPFFFVADLLQILENGFEVRFRSEESNEPSPSDSAIRKTRMRYERECLGRLLQTSDITSAIEIAATSDNPAGAIERLLLQILTVLGPHFPKEHLLNPGLLRDFALPSDDESLVDLQESTTFHPDIATFLANLNANVNWSQLLFEEDLFELAHLDTLGTEHLRVGCRQILELSRRLKATEPHQIDLNKHEEGAETAFVDETHFPSGGLAGLTNRGSFENLLTSELVYLDEGTKDISLFELRYAEGELLFYLRDSGNLRRKRRSIHFVFDLGPLFETKQPGYDWQYSVLLQGLCLRLLHDLFAIFEMDALRFHFHYLKGKRMTPTSESFLEGEIGIMRTVLADYVKHGWVTFDTPSTLKLESLVDPKRKSYAVILTATKTATTWQDLIAPFEDEEPNSLHTAMVAVDTETDPTTRSPLGPLTNEAKALIELPRAGLTIEELAVRRDAILANLVG
ncbi:MAG: hypothetical protein AAF514_06100 [Verrucomicrobiota bacterium]